MDILVVLSLNFQHLLLLTLQHPNLLLVTLSLGTDPLELLLDCLILNRHFIYQLFLIDFSLLAFHFVESFTLEDVVSFFLEPFNFSFHGRESFFIVF